MHSAAGTLGPHPASYAISTAEYFRGLKKPKREADHTPATSAQEKNCGTIPALPHTSSVQVQLYLTINRGGNNVGIVRQNVSV